MPLLKLLSKFSDSIELVGWSNQCESVSASDFIGVHLANHVVGGGSRFRSIHGSLRFYLPISDSIVVFSFQTVL